MIAQRRRDGKGNRPPAAAAAAAAESYVSTPSGNDNDNASPGAAAADAFYREGDMREGGSKIQAEQISKEAPLQGTNNYASLLSSPGPSSIPSPSFKKKLSSDVVHSLLSDYSVSVSQPLRRLEGNPLQFIMCPPSPGSESSQILDVKYVDNASPVVAVSSMPEESLRFDWQSPEGFSRLVSLQELEVLIGDQSPETEASTPPGIELSDSSSARNFVEHVQLMSIVKAEQKESSNHNLLSKEGSAVSPAVPRIRSHEAKKSENAQARMIREPPPVGMARRKLKHTDVETTEVAALKRLGGAHVTGPRQIPVGKGPKRASSPGNAGSSQLQPQSTGKPLHWKAVPGLRSKEGLVSPHRGVPSIGSTGDRLLGSPHSWPGPESTLLGSPFQAPSMSRVESMAGQGIRNACTYPKTKVFPEHWSPQEVSKAMEAGQVFKACFRINSHNRSEAYVTIEGIPLDILIYGAVAQNRAMEGDFVAITLEPTSSWPRLKGSLNKQANSESSSSKQGAMESGKTINIDAHSSQEIVIDHTEAQFQDIDAGANARVLHEGEMTLEAHHQHFVQDTASNDQMHMKQETHVLPIEVSCDDSSQAFEKHAEGSSNTVIQILKLQGSGLTPGVGLQSLAQSNVEKEEGSHPRPGMVATAISSLALLVMSCPGRRPTGKVVAILEKSPRRESVVGFLETLQHSGNKPSRRGQQENHSQRRRSLGTMLLVPVDNRYPKMLVFSACLPDDLYERLKEGDATMPTELVAAQVDGWHSDSHLPNAVVKRSLGQGGQIEAQLKAILFEHGVHSAAFSQESLDCLPKIPWKISPHEIKRRVDLRGQRIFSIDPPTAKDLDDALSFECLENGVVRVGVHIADVSYFVSPNTALDKEAQSRSTSVYLEQQVVPMLPHLLCEELCSLNPGVDRLAFSIIWSISPAGDILDQWIGKTVIQSCAKLTYGHAQNMIDGVSTDLEEVQAPRDMQETESSLPKVHGKHTWQEVVADVQALYNVAKKLRDGRFEKGALKLNNSKLMFSLDEDGAPYESTMFKTKDSNFVVEEFMLLANMSVARVISNAFPDSALLRRHPEPNMRKLKEFEDFCDKNGFELNASSSGALHISLEKMQERFKHDPAVFNILMLLATKPMQLAKYFCTGELKDKEEEWSHYALATPFYTHFTSPIRRYPDILVHRMLAAALEAEEVIIQGESSLPCSRGKSSQALSLGQSNQLASKCFSGAKATKEATFVPSAQQALASAAIKHKLPGIADLAVIATHCNERKLASRNVKDASDKLYLWTMLKKKQGLLSDARVLALGSKFMSLYICKVAMERRIYYEEIEGVNAEWFAATGTLVLDISPPTVPKNWSNDSKPGRPQRTVADIATVVNPTDSIGSSPEEESYEDIIREVEERLAGKIYTDDISANFSLGESHLSSEVKVEPAVLPLTLRLFSMVPVSLHAAGGGNQPLEITVKLYISSYVTA